MDPAFVQKLDDFIAASTARLDNSDLSAPPASDSGDMSVITKFQEVAAEFTLNASQNLANKIISHEEQCQTFDSTTNYSLLNESKSSDGSNEDDDDEKERQINVEASEETVAAAFGATEQNLNEEKLAKFLEPKLESNFKKMSSKITLKGLKLDSALNNPEDV